MHFAESAHSFVVSEQQCIGILHRASGPVGVLVVVGGPQYRVGSHRQYVRLSRALAKSGVPSFRFDVRGMGDSTGEKQSFDDLNVDIECAINKFEALTGVKRFVLLGLCDAATACWIYAWHDKRVQGLVAINPWLKSTAAQGKVMLKHYYPDRLLNALFWRKLFSGEINFAQAFKDAFSFAFQTSNRDQQLSTGYECRMLEGAQRFNGKVCLILSGHDLTAKEFEQVTSSSKPWRQVLSREMDKHSFSGADHTFSDPKNETNLFDTILTFLRSV